MLLVRASDSKRYISVLGLFRSMSKTGNGKTDNGVMAAAVFGVVFSLHRFRQSYAALINRGVSLDGSDSYTTASHRPGNIAHSLALSLLVSSRHHSALYGGGVGSLYARHNTVRRLSDVCLMLLNIHRAQIKKEVFSYTFAYSLARWWLSVIRMGLFVCFFTARRYA